MLVYRNNQWLFTTHKNTPLVKMQFWSVKADGRYSNYCALKDQLCIIGSTPKTNYIKNQNDQ